MYYYNKDFPKNKLLKGFTMLKLNASYRKTDKLFGLFD